MLTFGAEIIVCDPSVVRQREHCHPRRRRERERGGWGVVIGGDSVAVRCIFGSVTLNVTQVATRTTKQAREWRLPLK